MVDEEMKKILVTGADGFIGSHLTEMLVAQGYEVTGLSQYNSFNSWGWLMDVDNLSKINIVTGDIRDPHFCKHITAGIDAIFASGCLDCYSIFLYRTDSYIDTNVKGTLNICQAAKENGVKRVIHVSSSLWDGKLCSYR